MITYRSIGEHCPEVLYINDQYIEHRYMWTLSRDFIKGEAAIKRKNELYLPMPTGFLLQDDEALGTTSSSSSHLFSFDQKYNFLGQGLFDDPNYHSNAPYSIYKHGAKPPAILKHTVNGLLGLIVKKPMEFIDEESNVYDLSIKERKANEK